MRLLAPLLLLPLVGLAPRGERLFTESARINGDGTVTLPAFRGVCDGRSVWYIVTEASDGDAADRFGVADADKLEDARGTAAVMRVEMDSNGMIIFPATVDFSPERVIVGDPEIGFPPLEAVPGSVGEPGYSPLIELPDGTVLNAPHVGNSTGTHDRLVRYDRGRSEVDMDLIDGIARDKPVLYITTDASSPVAAAIEAVTYAPALNAAPTKARAPLAAITNGQTGVGNRNRQGLNSALLGEGDPFNMLDYLPNQGNYSPLWDVHLSAFAPGVNPTFQERVADVEDLAEDGDITAPDGSRWGPSGFIVNCPVIQRVD